MNDLWNPLIKDTNWLFCPGPFFTSCGFSRVSVFVGLSPLVTTREQTHVLSCFGSSMQTLWFLGEKPFPHHITNIKKWVSTDWKEKTGSGWCECGVGFFFLHFLVCPNFSCHSSAALWTVAAHFWWVMRTEMSWFYKLLITLFPLVSYPPPPTCLIWPVCVCFCPLIELVCLCVCVHRKA